jgi:hypothetical protein
MTIPVSDSSRHPRGEKPMTDQGAESRPGLQIVIHTAQPSQSEPVTIEAMPKPDTDET